MYTENFRVPPLGYKYAINHESKSDKQKCLLMIILFIMLQLGPCWDLASILWEFYPTLGCHDIQNVLQISTPQ